jgi:hypothetical protein
MALSKPRLAPLAVVHEGMKFFVNDARGMELFVAAVERLDHVPLA